jgi:hypothetical protein
MQKIAMLALLVASTTALAGDHYRPKIRVYTSTVDGVTYAGGYGSLEGASNSPDDVQYITCTTQKYNFDGVVQHYGFCVATDKDWNSASCYTEDADMIDVMHSMGPQTEFGFSAMDGECISVWAANGSQYL